jgi:pimeloyl-ACP methyl ester carboxylesterase
MTRRTFLKASGAAAGAMTAAGNAQRARAAGKPRTFVLVHGAWHGGWCWRRVTDALAARGHRVFAPSLTGLGDRAHLFTADISLQTHVDDILSLVDAEELGDFVLVGHSYAGMVISGVADSLRERVSRYVYLDARLPFDMSPGASFSWIGFDAPELRETRLKSAREQGKGLGIPAPPPAAFGVTGTADAAWLARHLGPMPMQTYLGTFTFRRGGTDGLKRTYIATTKPPYSMLVPTHDRMKADKTWSFAAIETAHDAMVTAPDELASMLAGV